MFLMPDRQRFSQVAHSYILELKYLSAKDSAAKAETQWTEAVEQIHRYSDAGRLQQLIRDT